MSSPITLSIDVTLLDKSRFKHITRKDGTPAIFCDIILLPAKEGKDRFGNDGMVKQQTTKDERIEGKVEMPILGNFKKLEFRPQAAAQPQATAIADSVKAVEQSDDIPW
jgi:hypothetical protein